MGFNFQSEVKKLLEVFRNSPAKNKTNTNKWDKKRAWAQKLKLAVMFQNLSLKASIW